MSETTSLRGRKEYTDKSGKSGRVSPAIIEKYLAGIHYPSKKSGLVSIAKNNNAPDNVMKTIDRLPDKNYSSPIDITKEIGKIK
jgi:hypothetical protein